MGYNRYMPKIFTSETQKIGEFGETLVCEYLQKGDFKIVERNYYQTIGEIDIIALKDKILHFIEVKTVSCETLEKIDSLAIKPENNFTYSKSNKFKKIINFYLMKKNVSHETNIHIDLITVYISKFDKKAKIIPFWNIIL